VYKVYAESFRGEEHLARIFTDADDMIKRLSEKSPEAVK
jgi:phosphoglucomutase